jgi:hypothetical protein
MMMRRPEFLMIRRPELNLMMRRPCAALRCPALPCAALRCPALPCAALQKVVDRPLYYYLYVSKYVKKRDQE